jgi:hypothetical protein
MENGWVVAVAIIGALGGLGGAAALITVGPNVLKIRAEARKAHGEVEIAVAEHEDTHLLDIIRTQTEALVNPLTQRVKDLDARVKDLETALAASQRLSQTAIGFIRTLLAWINKHLLDVTEPVPPVPAELLKEL